MKHRKKNDLDYYAKWLSLVIKVLWYFLSFLSVVKTLLS